jgi:uncharacterized protein YxeA
MKSIISRIVVVLMLLAMGVCIVSSIISCGRPKLEKEKVETEKKMKIEQAITELVGRHNAVTGWEKNLREKYMSMLMKVYSIQVEEALIRNDRRPVLFFASIEDVARQDDKYFAHFHNWRSIGPDIHFVLECNLDQVEKVTEQSADYFKQYAVVALISIIQRPKFEPRAYSENGEEPEIAVESSDIFVAKGRCLDLLFIGDYGPEGE